MIGGVGLFADAIAPGPMMLGGIGPFAEALGVAVFALTGALVAARRGMDPFGFALLATVTGVGGGTLRDLLLGVRPVFWVADPRDVIICLTVAGVTFALGPRRVGAMSGGARSRLLLWADAVGLALFAVVGAQKALLAGAPAPSAVVLGAVTATFGGIIRDLLAGVVPLVLRQEIYVTAAAVGSGVLVGAVAAGLPPAPAALIGFTAALVLRGLAIQRGWQLPAFPKRD